MGLIERRARDRLIVDTIDENGDQGSKWKEAGELEGNCGESMDAEREIESQ